MTVGAAGSQPITIKDITNFVRNIADQGAAVIHNIADLPQNLLAAVVNSWVQSSGNLGYCFDVNGQQITASGIQVVELLQKLGFSPAQIALLTHQFSACKKTPGQDNLIRYSFTELKQTAENPHLNNAFYAKGQKALVAKNLDPFKQRKDPLAYVPEQLARLDQSNPIVTAEKTDANPGAKAVVYDLAGLLKLGAEELDRAPVDAGVKELQLLAAA